MASEITAVVTCFNYGAFVGEAVRSLAEQSVPADIVVVDDGSTDDATHAALDRLEGAGHRVVRQENSGVCVARNAGFEHASTPYVVFLDADDRLAPGALEALLGALEAAPESIGFAYGHQRFFGDLDAEFRFPPYDPFRLLYRHLIGPTALTRREVLIDTGGYDPGFGLYEDWEIWVNALAHGWRGIRVDAVTHEYRRKEGSKLGRDRRSYRAFRRQLRAKHRELFARRRELAAESDLGAGGRAAYRFFWGPRPLPAALEAAAHRRLWRPPVGSGPVSSGTA
jgi:glycosyltransferase involved in cell wall biosynthesis